MGKLTINGEEETDSQYETRIDNHVNKYPFIYIQRQERYKHVGSLDNTQGTGEGELEYSKSTSMETTKEKSWGGSVGVSFTYATEGSAVVVSTSYEVSFSLEFNWNFTTSNAYGKEESKTVTVAVPAGKYVQVVQIENMFRTYRLEPNGLKHHRY